MKSKSKISKQIQKKSSPKLVETVLAAKKYENWLGVAEILSGPRRKMKEVNLGDLEKAKEGETIVVAGKVLSKGEVSEKIKIAALNFSEKAKDKLKKAGCETLSILDEIKKNPDAEGIKILNAGSKTKEIFNK